MRAPAADRRVARPVVPVARPVVARADRRAAGQVAVRPVVPRVRDLVLAVPVAPMAVLTAATVVVGRVPKAVRRDPADQRARGNVTIVVVVPAHVAGEAAPMAGRTADLVGTAEPTIVGGRLPSVVRARRRNDDLLRSRRVPVGVGRTPICPRRLLRSSPRPGSTRGRYGPRPSPRRSEPPSSGSARRPSSIRRPRRRSTGPRRLAVPSGSVADSSRHRSRSIVTGSPRRVGSVSPC